MLTYFERASSALSTSQQQLSLQVRSVMLGVAPLPLQLEAAPMQLETAPTGATLAAVAGAVDKAEIASPSQVAATMVNLVNRARGKSKSCQPDVDCDSEWAQEANAVVLLVAADGSEGVYCTGRLPGVNVHLPANQAWVAVSCGVSVLCWQHGSATFYPAAWMLQHSCFPEPCLVHYALQPRL